jgi:MFS family permease
LLQCLLLMRAVVGFALGGTPVAVTLFAECCPSAGRGRWLLLMQSFWTLGERFAERCSIVPPSSCHP